MAGGSARWAVPAALAALLLVLGALVALRGPGRAQVPPGPDGGAAGAGCDVPPLAFPPMSAQGAPQVLLSGGPGVRFWIDGERALGPLDEPRAYPPGERTLRVEADGEEGLQTRFRLDPFAPALFHATVEPGAGLSLVRLGVVCRSCSGAFAELDLGKGPAGAGADAQVRFREAARAMREDDWQLAATILRDVPARARKEGTFLRLASSVYAAAIAPQRAREVLGGLTGADRAALQPALAAWDRAVEQEQARRLRLLVARWNRLTDRFADFGQRYEPSIRSQMGAAALRMEQLSPHFEAAVSAGDESAQEAAILAVEALLLRLARDVLGTRPENDCAFQAEVSATLLR